MGPPATSQASGRASTAATTPPVCPTILPPSTMAFQGSAEVDTNDGLNLFDEMPPSEPFYSNMMADSFNIDDISLSNQFPLANNEDVVEVNPTPIAKKRWARSANYSVEEDEALVVARENVSLDPVIGRDQSMKTYWMRIADHFHQNVKKPSNRSISSLSHHWSTIQECCNRWASCIVSIDRLHPSGMTIQDRTNLMHKLYKDREKQHKPFVMLHCWTLLEHNEKWNNRDNDFHPLKKKASKSSLEFENEGDGNEDDEEDSDIPSSAVANKKRPPRRKQEKERLKKGGDGVVIQSAVQEMIATKMEMEANRKSEKE
ncbi:hypothetical protein C2845_PM03G07690 [Panicum miliaceum]|uniref:No apical meristem-associated C-terminal domain-containing protein n=1 Tax=Panicum miliaceum TaxID=4540 RepID=A0A3L6TFT0_PANMI|nr:hypothetical protein C2845_PM03G07690 [Panicum miliaceum]